MALAMSRAVDLQVFDLGGRLVKILAHGDEAEGEYVVQWRGEDNGGARVASGIYFVRMETNEDSFSNRVVLLK